MDIVLGGFSKTQIDNFSMEELTRFSVLLDEIDADLLSWITGQFPLPDDVDKEMFELIVKYQASVAGNE